MYEWPLNIADQTEILFYFFSQVKSLVAASIDQLEPLVADDRDLDRLNSYLRAKASRPISIGNLKKLISCVLVHNPFLRHCIKGEISQWDREYFKWSPAELLQNHFKASGQEKMQYRNHRKHVLWLLKGHNPIDLSRKGAVSSSSHMNFRRLSKKCNLTTISLLDSGKTSTAV